MHASGLASRQGSHLRCHSRHSSNDGSLDVEKGTRMSMATVELAVGDKAPDFLAEITDGTKVNLSEILSSGEGVILYFYPRDSTPGCTTQACDFRDSFDRLKEGGWRVIGVSTDSAKSHQKFTEKNDLPFELIVDEEATLHESYGTWREKKMYGKTYMGTLRSTFAIGQDGTLEWVGYGVRAKGHVDGLIEALKVS